MKKLLAVILVALSFTNAKAQLTKEEKKLMEYIDANMPRAIELLKESVNVNSGTLNIEGVKKVGAIYRRELEKAGMQTEWVSMPDSIKRAGHLVASTLAKKPKGKKLFLIGHLDTVFEPDMPANPFTMINDSTATGQGANDMKGGDVVMIIALQALQAQGLLKDDIRGITTSSARRETPSAVFGISTPGPIDKEGPKGKVGKFEHVIPEAFMAGIPVISTAVNGIPEYVNESNGILIQAKDEEGLLAAFKSLIDSQPFQKEKLRAYAMEHFSYAAVGKSISDVYEKVLR